MDWTDCHAQLIHNTCSKDVYRGARTEEPSELSATKQPQHRNTPVSDLFSVAARLARHMLARAPFTSSWGCVVKRAAHAPHCLRAVQATVVVVAARNADLRTSSSMREDQEEVLKPAADKRDYRHIRQAAFH